MLLFQHHTACSGRDSWRPHCEISSQLQQKVWSPENIKVGILAIHRIWKWKFNEAGVKSHSFCFQFSKGHGMKDTNIFYLMGTFSYISDLTWISLFPLPSTGIHPDSGGKKYDGQEVNEFWKTVLLPEINLVGHVQEEWNILPAIIFYESDKFLHCIWIFNYH